MGHLYRGIEDGLKYLPEKFGEEQLFIGPPTSQIADAFFSLPGLAPVTDLESAVSAIEGIVERGRVRGTTTNSLITAGSWQCWRSTIGS